MKSRQEATNISGATEATTGYLIELGKASVGLLTTFRRNGAGVSTPVGIKVIADKVYFTTWSTSGKVKRLNNNPRVTVAPSTRQGKATGPSTPGTARRLDGEEAKNVRGLIGSRFQAVVWEIIYKIVFRAEPVRYEITLGNFDGGIGY